MKHFIDPSIACPVGLRIVSDATDAFLSHRLDVTGLYAPQLEHLKNCPVCNPELKTKAMIHALWPGAMVSE